MRTCGTCNRDLGNADSECAECARSSENDTTFSNVLKFESRAKVPPETEITDLHCDRHGNIGQSYLQINNMESTGFWKSRRFCGLCVTDMFALHCQEFPIEP